MVRYLALLWIAVMLGAAPISASKAEESTDMKEHYFIDFSQGDPGKNWEVVNDVVMGGLSDSEFSVTGSGTAVFKGTVSLENYGGFASVRSLPTKYDLAAFDGILLAVKGDGKRYSFRVRLDDAYDGIAYQMPFMTKADEWITVKIPLKRLEATYRGRKVPNPPPMDPDKIRSIGFLISDKQAGPFRLEIARIGAYSEGASAD